MKQTLKYCKGCVSASGCYCNLYGGGQSECLGRCMDENAKCEAIKPRGVYKRILLEDGTWLYNVTSIVRNDNTYNVTYVESHTRYYGKDSIKQIENQEAWHE